MSYDPSLPRLAEQEPWRLGKGLPRNALDPTWTPSPLDQLCDGEIDWEAETGWWVCKKCGYVGSAYYTAHKPILHPLTFFLQSLSFYVEKQRARARNTDALINIALCVAGTALRYAATLPPERLGEYIDGLAIKW